MIHSIKIFLKSNKLIYVLIALAIVINILLFTRYRSENVDESWFLSFYYNFTHKGIETDQVFQLTDGQAGVQYFGKVIALFYSCFLNIIGWNRLGIALVGFALVISGAFFWYKSILKIFQNKRFALITFLFFIFLEPFVANINSSRVEAFLFFLSGLSLYLFLNKKYFFAILLSLIAIETHPLGVLSLIQIIIYYAVYRPKLDSKKYLFIFLGFLSGSLLYLLLHYSTLSHIAQFLGSNTKTGWSNLFIQYFWEANYKRHLFELLILIISAFIFIKRKYFKEYKFIAYLSILNLILLLLFPRPNINYVSLFSIGLFLLITLVIAKSKYFGIFLIFIVSVISVQYIFTLYKNWNVKYDVEKVAALIKDDGTPIVGSSTEWMSFKDREYYAASDTGKIPSNLKSFFLLADDIYRSKEPNEIAFKEYILQKCNLTEVLEKEIGEVYEVYKVVCY
jgi:hypothetical protein